MPDLFKRDWLIRVDTIQVGGLDVRFDIEKTIKKKPNTGTVTIWGLSLDQRLQLEALSVKKKQAGRIRVEIEAGYIGARPLLFRGDLRTAYSDRQGAEIATTIENGDGHRSILNSRITKSYPPGTPVSVVIRDCSRAMGLGIGNMEGLAVAARTRGGSVFSSGTVLSGNASEELTGVLRSCGLTWSVQNGVLQVLRAGQALNSTAVKLSPETGLIGEIAPNPDGTILARSLIQPGLDPGGRVYLSTDRRKGTYTISQVKFTGDTTGNDWYADLLLVEG